MRKPIPAAVLVTVFVALVAVAAFWSAACDLNVGSTTPDTDITYYNFAQDFMTTYCVGCHNGHRQFSLASYNAVKSHKDEVKSEVDSGDMPPEDAAVYPSIGEERMLIAWINDGAPEGTPIDSGDDDSDLEDDDSDEDDDSAEDDDSDQDDDDDTDKLAADAAW